ncbi:GNAT family N-acetyltransferase, partial [Ruegeria sp. NA]
APSDNSDIMLAIQQEGGLVAGAFKDRRMLGFLFGFPTSHPDAQHSHRLAVHPDSRGMGLGAKLKWYQRDWCLQRGINVVRWTY